MINVIPDHGTSIFSADHVANYLWIGSDDSHKIDWPQPCFDEIIIGKRAEPTIVAVE